MASAAAAVGLVLCAMVSTIRADLIPSTTTHAGSGDWSIRLGATTLHDKPVDMVLTDNKVVMSGSYSQFAQFGSLPNTTCETNGGFAVYGCTQPVSWVAGAELADGSWAWSHFYNNVSVESLSSADSQLILAGNMNPALAISFPFAPNQPSLKNEYCFATGCVAASTAWIGLMDSLTGTPQWGKAILNTTVTSVAYGGSDSLTAVLMGQLHGSPFFSSTQLKGRDLSGSDGYIAGMTSTSAFAWALKLDNCVPDQAFHADGTMFVMGQMRPGYNLHSEHWYPWPANQTLTEPYNTGINGTLTDWAVTPTLAKRWLVGLDASSGQLRWRHDLLNVTIESWVLAETHRTITVNITTGENATVADKVVIFGGTLSPTYHHNMSSAPNTTNTSWIDSTWSFGKINVSSTANASSWIGAMNRTSGEWLWVHLMVNTTIKGLAYDSQSERLVVMGRTFTWSSLRAGPITRMGGESSIGPSQAWVGVLHLQGKNFVDRLDIRTGPSDMVWDQVLSIGDGNADGSDLWVQDGKIYVAGEMLGGTTAAVILKTRVDTPALAGNPETRAITLQSNQGRRDYFFWRTQINDTLVPLLLTQTPAHQAVNQSATLQVKLYFNEPVRVRPGMSIYITPVTGCTAMFDRASHTILVDSGNTQEVTVESKVVTIAPTTQLLPYGLEYALSMDPNTIVDFSGNGFIGFTPASSTTPGRFQISTIEQFSLPVNQQFVVDVSGLSAEHAAGVSATSFAPKRGQLNVHRSTNIEITFNQPIKLGFGEIYLTSVGGVDYDENRVLGVNDTQVSLVNGNTTLRINPSWDLDNRGHKNYTVEFAECFVLNMGNLPFSGLTKPLHTELKFKIVDTDVPVVMSYTPVQGAANVDRSSNIVLTFNETMTTNQGWVRLTPTGGDHVGRILTIPVPPLDKISRNRVICSGKVCTIDPRHDLDDEAGTNWTITMPSGTLTDHAGNPYAGLSGEQYSFYVVDVTPEVSVYPDIEGYASTRPPLTYKPSPYESHMGPARVYGEDGFNHPGFRSLDGLSMVSDARAIARDALYMMREDVFFDGLDSIMPDSNYHYSPLHKTVVQFSYHYLTYPNDTTTSGQAKFDDVTNWKFNDLQSTSLFGGEMNAFGSFYAAQAYTKGFTCFSWSRTDRDGYRDTLAYRLHPIAGLPNILISGHLDSLRYNSRPSQENTTISWKLVRYFSDDLDANFTVLTHGTYLLKNVGTEIPVVIEGDYWLGDPPREMAIQVDDFVEGSIALVVRNDYTEEIPSYGHLLVCDPITWRLSPAIPFTTALPDESPLLVDPANGTKYNIDVTLGMPDRVGALWHTAKAVVGLGFDSTFKFKIFEVSRSCQVFPEIKKHCDTRGGDGFAFVIHNGVNGSASVGTRGRGCGYDGLDNALAIEFDTWYNHEDHEPYNNHISVQTGGTKKLLSSHHSQSLASTTDIQNFADEKEHTVRITYNNTLDLNGWITRNRARQAKDRFQASVMAFNYAAQLLNSDSQRFRPGLLSIYLDNMDQPILQVPLNLASILGLDAAGPHGSAAQTVKAWVGFTASTGSAWQRHQIMDWQYTSLPTQHSHVVREEYCKSNMLPETDDPTCHAPVWTSRPDDRFTDQHVGRDPRATEFRGDGHGTHLEYGGGHPETIFNTNFDKFYKPQMLTHSHLLRRGQLDQPEVLSHPMPSDGRVGRGYVGL